MKHSTLAFVLAAASFAVFPAHADTLRCGNKLIQPGMQQGYVLTTCGAPASKKEVTEPIRARRENGTTYEVGTTTQEIWRYVRRPGQFPAILVFEGGVLKSLDFEK